MNEDNFHLGVKALIQNKKGEILLLKVNVKMLKQYSGDVYWDIPGGRIQKGGTVDATLKREVFEETGIDNVMVIKPFAMVLSNIRIPVGDSSVGLVLSSYLCSIDENTQIKLSEEHVEFGWFLPYQAVELLKVKYPTEFVEKISSLVTTEN